MAEVLDQAAPPDIHLSEVLSSADHRWREHRPLLIAITVYLVSSAALLFAGWRLADGHFFYPLDDVYINMAVAKNFAAHGVWGISPYEFSSATSSPLYVLLLSGVYRIFGATVYAPLALSWMFGLGALMVAARMVRERLSEAWQTGILAALVLLTPLFGIGTLGMEHTLHLLLTLIFLRHFERPATSVWLLGSITLLMAGARYEGILLAAAATLVLLAQRRWLRAAVVGIAAWVPAACYGVFSIAHGGYWLPNSVAIKGLRMSGLSVAARLLHVGAVSGYNLRRAPHLGMFVVILAVMAVSLRRLQPRAAATLTALAGASLLHLATADVGWAFRYEAYLVGAALIVVACSWRGFSVETPRLAAVTAFVLFAALSTLILRATLAAELLPRFGGNVYLQQWQTARFLQAAYPGGSVAANDVGAINYLSDLHCVDLAGLASGEVFNAKRSGGYNTGFLARMAKDRGVEVAIVYDSWFAVNPITPLGGPPLPAGWTRVRRWTVPEKLQLGDRTVSFYAPTPELAAQLRRKLDAFQPLLPSEVKVSE